MVMLFENLNYSEAPMLHLEFSLGAVYFFYALIFDIYIFHRKAFESCPGDFE